MNPPRALFERLALMAPTATLCLVAALLTSSALGSGCGRRAERREARRQARAAQNEEVKARPAVNPTLTPEGLLRETTYVYANAKYYSDEGYVELLCETESKEQTRQTRSYRVPCSVSIAKPNCMRVNLGSSLLRCDGKTTRAEILDKAFQGQKLESPAPLVVAAIKEFYPDATFAQAADLGVPTNLFWTSPQLVLLYAKDPKKTFVPDGAKLKTLEPEYLQFDADDKPLECDRLQITAEDGVRVLWIARSTKTLVRCELPLEQTASPFDETKVVAIRIDFPKQVVSDAPIDDLSAFELPSDDADVRAVDKFLPQELLPLKRVFPIEALENLSAGTEPEPERIRFDQGKSTLLYLWSASDSSSLNFSASQAFAEASTYPFDRSRLQFAAVNVDVDQPDEETLARSAATGLRVPSTRLDPNAAREQAPDFPKIEAPALVLLDEQGVVVKCVCDRFSFERLQKILTRALDGTDVGAEDFSAYYAKAARFAEFVEESDVRDLYRSATDFADPIFAPARAFPKTFGMREIWRFNALYAPSNPLAVMKSELKPQLKTVSVGEEFAPLAEESQIPDELVVVPCDGNALALISTSGSLIRKTSPAAAPGEPIEFARTIAFGSGKRYYAASAKGQSGKLHRFDKDFHDLGSLDVGRARDQFVGDALFADVDGDDEPELLVSLLNGPLQNDSQTNGVYCVDMEARKILWKNESIASPRRLGAFFDSGENRLRLFAIDSDEGLDNSLAELDPRTGEKLDEIRVPQGNLILSFATTPNAKDDSPNIVAIVSNIETNRASFVGIGPNGEELWRSPVPNAPDSEMERIVALDLNYDGYDEWAVASPDGVAQFFDANGTQLDVFQYGEEISGICSATWNDETYLILSDLNKVSAWKIETRRPTRNNR